jgi:putative transcriptional regulator
VLHRVCKRWVLAAVAVVASAGVLHAALPTSPDISGPTSPDISGPTSFTGQLLIATPALRDSSFDHAVILVAQHNKEGALGIVINHPLDQRPIGSLIQALGGKSDAARNPVRVFLGGPVSPEIAFVVHGADYRLPDTLDIDGRIALSAAPDVLRDMALGRGPRKSLIALGYAGWGPSQLDDEIQRGDWFSVPEDQELVFDDDRTKVWVDAIARHKP